MKNQIYTVKSREKFELILERSIRRNLIEVTIHLVFFAFWYSFLYNSNFKGANAELSFIEYLKENPLVIIFWCAGIFILPSLYQSIKLIAGKANLIFDITNDQFKINNEYRCRLSDVINLQIRAFTDHDGDSDYRLSLVLDDGSKVFIDRGSDHGSIERMAEEIADFLDVSVKVKN